MLVYISGKITNNENYKNDFLKIDIFGFVLISSVLVIAIIFNDK